MLPRQRFVFVGLIISVLIVFGSFVEASYRKGICLKQPRFVIDRFIKNGLSRSPDYLSVCLNDFQGRTKIYTGKFQSPYNGLGYSRIEGIDGIIVIGRVSNIHRDNSEGSMIIEVSGLDDRQKLLKFKVVNSYELNNRSIGTVFRQELVGEKYKKRSGSVGGSKIYRGVEAEKMIRKYVQYGDIVVAETFDSHYGELAEAVDEIYPLAQIIIRRNNEIY
jgi:hypothetical protein